MRDVEELITRCKQLADPSNDRGPAHFYAALAAGLESTLRTVAAERDWLAEEVGRLAERKAA